MTDISTFPPPPAALLPHAFEPGVRGHPGPGAADGGAGLGLAIAKRLLEHQHATLTAENPAGGGAEVRLTFRRAASDASGEDDGWGRDQPQSQIRREHLGETRTLHVRVRALVLPVDQLRTSSQGHIAVSSCDPDGNQLESGGLPTRSC